MEKQQYDAGERRLLCSVKIVGDLKGGERTWEEGGGDVGGRGWGWGGVNRGVVRQSLSFVNSGPLAALPVKASRTRWDSCESISAGAMRGHLME